MQGKNTPPSGTADSPDKMGYLFSEKTVFIFHHILWVSFLIQVIQ